MDLESRASSLDKEEIDIIVKDSIRNVLFGQSFHSNKVDNWISKIMEASLRKLSSAAKQYKYVVSCKIFQNAGAGAVIGASTLWDKTTDDYLTVNWESEHILCITTVYWAYV